MWTWTLQLERDDSRHTSQWVKLVSVDVIKLGAHNDAHFIAFLVSYPSSSFSTEKVPLGRTCTVCLTSSHKSLQLHLFHSWSTKPRGMDKSRKYSGKRGTPENKMPHCYPAYPLCFQGKICGLSSGFSFFFFFILR